MSDQDFDSDESDFLPCENCGEDIYADAVQCPYCGWFLTWESTSGRSPRWERLVQIGMWTLGLGALVYLALWLAS